MSNLFESVLSDAKGVEEKILGPDYDYVKKIKSPEQLGISDDGNLSTLVRDIDGLIRYTEVLVTGDGASTTGEPLGNKFFLQTGQKCKDVATGEEVTRHVYIDNVPNGSIPFITSAFGAKFTTFEGLIPGAMSSVTSINPFAMMQSFLSGGVPDCKSVTLEVVNNNNMKSLETHFLTLVDINNLEGFENNNSLQTSTIHGNTKFIGKKDDERYYHKPQFHAQFAFIILSIIGVFLLYKLMRKR